MIPKAQRVMIVGRFETFRLECSYKTAFSELECDVLGFDIVSRVERYARLGRVGRLLNRFVPIHAWSHKANREMVLEAIRFEPDLLVTVGQCPIEPGALAQIQASINTYLVHIWPDTLLNLGENSISCLPVYDLVATYSQSTVKLLETWGARQVLWVPLAGDPNLHFADMHSSSESNGIGADVAFIGGWRPERESVLSKLDGFSLKIWGPEWGRRCRGNRTIMKAWQGRPLFGSELASAVAGSRVNLNIIDPTNYPAANMRFFEIPTAGGLQVASSCPEMEGEFRDGEHIFYYKQPEEIPELIRSLLSDDNQRARVATAGHAKVLGSHTYVHRARLILQQLGFDNQ